MNEGSSCEQYLKALQCFREAPTLDFLRRLIDSQQKNFPYENVSKLIFLGRGEFRTASLDEYLYGQKMYGFGGTCIAQNAHFSTLLKDLGFEASLVSVATNGQDDHASSIVTLGARNWRVDLGLMSPFATLLPLGGEPVEKSEGYRILRYYPCDDGMNYRLEIWRDGQIRRHLRSTSGSRTLKSFEQSVLRSFETDSIFMKNLCVYKVIGDTELTIWNNEYHVSSAGKTSTRTLSDVQDMRSVLAAEFALPQIPIVDAIRIITERNGIDIFASAKG